MKSDAVYALSKGPLEFLTVPALGSHFVRILGELFFKLSLDNESIGTTEGIKYVASGSEYYETEQRPNTEPQGVPEIPDDTAR